MKKIVLITGLIILTTFIISCKKESADVSRITYYAALTIQGDQYMVINKGTAFVDPGVEAIMQGQEVPYDTEGSVDENTPGVYRLDYSVTNGDGFTSSTFRIVGVIDPTAASNDYSGNYERTSNGVGVHWTKVANGLYICDNVGGVDPIGSPAWSFPVRVFNYQDSTIEVPVQPNPLGGDLYCDNAKYYPSVIKYSWIVMGAGFGTSTRTFVKL